jgi:uncharacterized damage-inducible protein DinB
MTAAEIPRPGAGEYAPFYDKYISLVRVGAFRTTVNSQITDSVTLLSRLTADQAAFAYAPGKWTVKEVVGHLIDAERVFAYRAMRIARGDKTDLPGFDENAFVANAKFNARTLPDLLEEFQAVRRATITLANSLDEEELARKGTANGHAVSVRALFYICLGHEAHHLALLKGRYNLA